MGRTQSELIYYTVPKIWMLFTMDGYELQITRKQALEMIEDGMANRTFTEPV